MDIGMRTSKQASFVHTRIASPLVIIFYLPIASYQRFFFRPFIRPSAALFCGCETKRLQKSCEKQIPETGRGKMFAALYKHAVCLRDFHEFHEKNERIYGRENRC